MRKTGKLTGKSEKHSILAKTACGTGETNSLSINDTGSISLLTVTLHYVLAHGL